MFGDPKRLDAVLASSVRLFLSSSCVVYGIPSTLPIQGGAPKEAINLYGSTKLFFERMLSVFSVCCGLRYVAASPLRCSGLHFTGFVGRAEIVSLAIRIASGMLSEQGPPAATSKCPPELLLLKLSSLAAVRSEKDALSKDLSREHWLPG